MLDKELMKFATWFSMAFEYIAADAKIEEATWNCLMKKLICEHLNSVKGIVDFICGIRMKHMSYALVL